MTFRTTLSLFAGLLATAALVAAQEPRQPSVSHLLPTLAQLGPEWTSNQVVVLVDPRSSPSERADPNAKTPEGWLRFARELTGPARPREAYALVRYFWGTNGMEPGSAALYISRYKPGQPLGDDWSRGPRATNSPGALPRVGEQVRFQANELEHCIAFRRSNYLVAAECPIPCGVGPLKRLLEVADGNLVKAQEALAAEREKRAMQNQPK